MTYLLVFGCDYKKSFIKHFLLFGLHEFFFFFFFFFKFQNNYRNKNFHSPKRNPNGKIFSISGPSKSLKREMRTQTTNS
jgi:hypothetical protein